MTSGAKRAPYVRRYGCELVSKPTIFQKKSVEGATTEQLLVVPTRGHSRPVQPFVSVPLLVVEMVPTTHPPFDYTG